MHKNANFLHDYKKHTHKISIVLYSFQHKLQSAMRNHNAFFVHCLNMSTKHLT